MRQELASYVGEISDTVECTGVDVALSPDSAQSIGMVIHELTTSVVKHGALARENGRLKVTWTIEETNLLRLTWTERFPPNSTPPPKPQGGGFGTALLKNVVENQLGGALACDLTEGGLDFVAKIPCPSDEGKRPPADPTPAPRR